MRLPDQITPERLAQIIATYEARLDRAEPAPPGPRILAVELGTAIRVGHSAAEIVPRHGQPLGLSVPAVTVLFEPAEACRTSPAHLVRLDGAKLTGPSSTKHALSGAQRASFAVPSGRFFIELVGPTETETKTWAVPACATHIAGAGRLVYASGHEVVVSGRQVIGRPSVEGLVLRPGGVYCTFHSDSPALVRIGNAWIETLPA